MKTIHCNVEGMTCASCEVLIERAAKKVPGVHKVFVSKAKDTATIHCDDAVQLEDVQAAVSEKGYRLVPKDAIAEAPRPSYIVKNKQRLSEIGSMIVIIIGVYLLLKQLNILPDGIGVTDNMSYGFVLVLGLVAGTSTCLAVAGGLLLAIANKYNEANPHLSGIEKFKPHIWFNTGRIVSYALLGGAIGFIGSALTVSPRVTGIITLASGVLMIIMGLQLLQIFPWMSRIQLKMPKFIAHKIYDAGHDHQKSTGKTSSFLFGAATFLLPCGFTQALQLYVLGKGDPVIGALTMAAFSLGTLPSLAGIGALSSFSKGSTQRYFTTFSAVLVIILGIFAMPGGLTLTGISLNGDDVGVASQVGDLLPLQDKQTVHMEVRGFDYYPAKFTVKKGIPVEWTIDGRNAQGCAQVITLPDMGITERLPRDTVKTLTFTPQKTGKMTFTCSMGMAGPGVFEVI